MKRQTTTQRALAIRKTTAARKHQKGFAMEWIIIVLLVAAALVPLVIYFSHVMQKDITTAADMGRATSTGEAKDVATKHSGQDQQDLEADKGTATEATENITGQING